jgi:hypothetical protein
MDEILWRHSPRAEEEDPAKACAVEGAEVLGHRFGDLDRIEPRGQLGERRVFPRPHLPLRDRALDQLLVCQPLDGAALHAGVVEGEPRLTQIGEVQQHVLEPAEGASPGDGPLPQVPRPLVPHAADEVLHVPICFSGRDRLDADHSPIRRVLLLAKAGGEGVQVGLRGASARVEPPHGFRRVVLQRFCQ